MVNRVPIILMMIKIILHPLSRYCRLYNEGKCVSIVFFSSTLDKGTSLLYI